MNAPAKTTNLQRAREAWGADVPDWVQALADECDRTSQRVAGRRIDYSAGLVCNVLKAKYNGDLRAVEQLVRGAFMAETVDCPVFGEMSSATCLGNQRAEWSSRRAMILAACPTCPHSRTGGKS